MYDTLIAFHILDLIQKSLERISFRFSDIFCPDDFLLSESGMMKLDSICMKLTAIGESIKIWIRWQTKNYWLNIRRFHGGM